MWKCKLNKPFPRQLLLDHDVCAGIETLTKTLGILNSVQNKSRRYNGRSLYFAFNFHWDAHEFFLPNVEMGETWKVLIDTAGQPEGLEIQKKYEMQPRSITIFESVRKPRKRKRDAGKQHPVND